jgi:hypothetical protein
MCLSSLARSGAKVALMSVDMYERRFRIELKEHPAFVPNDERDEVVWDTKFPAWRSLFSSLCLYGHSTGYRLPSYDDFFRYCETAYTKRNPSKEEYSLLFKDHYSGIRQRISAWYESGMAETHLYVCLIDAIEDRDKRGIVLYDPRADWKLKADLVVIISGTPIRVSAFVGDASGRSAIEARRDTVERERKKNTMESAHWDNAELAAMKTLQISRTATDLQIVNGVRLFSRRAINELLSQIYDSVRV